LYANGLYATDQETSPTILRTPILWAIELLSPLMEADDAGLINEIVDIY
jgi:hypothetical protein